MPSGRAQRTGETGETMAVTHLEAHGWRILARNWRPHGMGLRGEIDVVAERHGVLAFVEVKTRRSDAFGGPLVAVTPTKRRRLRQLATAYLSTHEPGSRTIRFDVIGITIGPEGPELRHVEHAF